MNMKLGRLRGTEGQGSPLYGPWSHGELDTTEQQQQFGFTRTKTIYEILASKRYLVFLGRTEGKKTLRKILYIFKNYQQNQSAQQSLGLRAFQKSLFFLSRSNRPKPKISRKRLHTSIQNTKFQYVTQ